MKFADFDHGSIESSIAAMSAFVGQGGATPVRSEPLASSKALASGLSTGVRLWFVSSVGSERGNGVSQFLPCAPFLA